MKKAILLILVIVLATGCLGTRKSLSTTHTKTTSDSVATKSETIKTTQVNKAINDTVSVQVPGANTGDKNLDELVNKKVAEILRTLNTGKTSGDNSYRLYYDEQLRQLRALFKVGQTQDTATSEVSETKQTTTSEEEQTSEFKKVVTTLPWWAWVLAVLLLQKPIAGIVSTFVPWVATTKLYGRIMS